MNSIRLVCDKSIRKHKSGKFSLLFFFFRLTLTYEINHPKPIYYFSFILYIFLLCNIYPGVCPTKPSMNFAQYFECIVPHSTLLLLFATGCQVETIERVNGVTGRQISQSHIINRSEHEMTVAK